MKSNISQKRAYYLDILRILATLAVVFFHATGVGENAEIGWSKGFATACAGITRWCVPIFAMISGVLFLDNSKPLPLKKLYGKNILRILIAFFFWSVVYAVYFFESFTLFLESLIMGRYHMWFLFMITGLYILTPLLRKITAQKETTEYFLLVGIVFGIGIATFKTTPLATVAPGITNYVFDNLGLEFFASYTFFFVLGYYLNTYTLNKKVNAILIILGLVGCALSIFLTLVSLEKEGVPYYYYHFFLPVTLECVGVFLLGKTLFSKMSPSEKGEKIILALSKYSFGVYLVHDLILVILSPFVKNLFGSLPPVAIIVATAVVTVISLAISAVLNSIPVVKKYIV